MRLFRRVEIGLLTASAIRGPPVKGLSLADHAMPDAALAACRRVTGIGAFVQRPASKFSETCSADRIPIKAVCTPGSERTNAIAR